MDFRTIKQQTKDALVGNRLMLFLVILVYSAIVGALSYIGVGFLIVPIFMAGILAVCKLLFREKRIDFNLLFSYFKDLNQAAKLLGVYLLQGLIVLGGTLLLIIPGIIFAYQYSQSINILADNPELGVWEAMKKSKEVMVGHKFEYFLFQLSFIGHILLIGITFGLYGIYALPYIQAAMINYYLHLTGQDDENPAQLETSVNL